MVLVPEGPAWIGCNTLTDEICRQPLPLGKQEEYPYHEVYLSSFYIDRYEVTVDQVADYLNDNGNLCSSHPCVWPQSTDNDYLLDVGEAYSVVHGFERYPAVWVTWFGADAICKWRGLRLCTEAEWEKAGRGDDGRLFPWGNDPPSCETSVLLDYFTPPCDAAVPFPVGSRPEGASPYGVEDMIGNVREWVGDWYERGYWDSEYRDPLGPETGEKRVTRGGSYMSLMIADDLGLSRRRPERPETSSMIRGFRCCSSVCE